MTTLSIRATSLALSLTAASIGAFAPSRAIAQSNEAIAESLFHEGKKLYAEKRYAEACQKLDQSHRADPAGGTVLLLAMCYERQGRTSSAWAKYSEALALARRDGRSDREQRSKEAMDALEPELTYLTVSLEPEAKALTNMEFVLDGAAIPFLVDAKVPVDPGEHELTVRAKGCEPWSHKVSATDKGSTVIVTVPGLKPAAPEPIAQEPLPPLPAKPEPPPLVSQPPALEPKSNATRTVAYVIGGAGVIAAGFGGYFAWHAKSLDNKANNLCPDATCNDHQAVAWSQDANGSARTATWFVGAGAAAMATAGAMLILGSNSGPRVSTTAIALPSGGALYLSGQY